MGISELSAEELQAIVRAAVKPALDAIKERLAALERDMLDIKYGKYESVNIYTIPNGALSSFAVI